MTALSELQTIAEIEFCDIVSFCEISKDKLRLYLTDESFIDIWLSKKVLGHYAFHWERGHINGSIYRHDNIPDKRWRAISTFPKHLHNGSEENVKESTLSDEPKEALRQFLIFTKRILNKGH